MVEDYRIIIRTGSTEPTGQYIVNRKGNRKPVLKYAERYETRAGTFPPEVWKAKAMEAIKADDELELMEKVKEYCRNHCAWLKLIIKNLLLQKVISCLDLCAHSFFHNVLRFSSGIFCRL